MAAASVRKRLGLPFGHPAILIATWFGTGLLPVAPGSWGSLVALPFAWAICGRFGPAGLIAAAAVLFVVGCAAAETVCRASGLKDAGSIVVDEVAAQWLVLAVAPLHPAAYVAGFLLFRVADIVKPWPASWADRQVAGGLGVMLDDMISALYAGALLFVLVRTTEALLG